MNPAHCLRVAIISIALTPVCAFAQQPRQYTDADYANAEKLMPYNVNPLAYKGQVNAQWLDHPTRRSALVRHTDRWSVPC